MAFQQNLHGDTNMQKEEMSKELQAQLQTVKEHAADLNKLCESLSQAIRGDVSFIALDETKAVLEGMKDVREAVEKSRKALKARAVARMKEG